MVNTIGAQEERLPKTAIGLLALVMLVSFVTRGLLLGMAGDGNVPFSVWPRTFLLGAWFDLLVAMTAVSPILLLAALFPDRWRLNRFYATLRFLTLWAICLGLLFAAVAEITFWLEFSTRFNFIAVDYLLYTNEVIGNIRESYPIFWILVGLSFAAVLMATPFSVWSRPLLPRPLRLRILYGFLGLTLPMLSWFSANIDRMAGSGNAYADELSGNGLMTFMAAFRRNELDYDRFYDTLPQAEADRILKGLGVERVPLSEAMRPQADHDPEPMGPLTRTPKHVVLISEESLSAEFLGSYGNRKGLTPNLDRLASEGYRFTQVYATGTRTVRGLEALSLGTPPVPGQAIVRRPENEHLESLGQVLSKQGFQPLFLYGGYGYFDNMNAFFQSNDYAVVDRSDFKKDTIAFENVWGVADESLFLNAIPSIRQASADGKRVFAHIMTTSNHRPFTYPDGRIDIPSPGGRDGAIKYSDFAIGHFMEEARKEPWFRDTLFIITADHCASVAGKTSLPVDKYRIPMIWYGPGLVTPGVDTRMVSQMDLPPTLLDVLGVQGDDLFFGLSIFEQNPAQRRAFISNYQDLGYVKNGILTVLRPQHRSQAFRVDPDTLEMTPSTVDPVLHDEAVAYYQTTARAFRQGRLALPDFARTRHWVTLPGPIPSAILPSPSKTTALGVHYR